MALNSLWPGFVRLEYLAATTKHIAILPCAPVNLAGVWNLTLKGGANQTFTAAIDAYMVVLRPCSPATMTFVSAQLWTLANPTADPVFVQEYGLNLAGTAAGGIVVDSQIVTTYRTGLGGLYRHYQMESSLAALNTKYKGPNFMNAVQLALINYIIGANGWIIGRDSGTLIVAISQITKTNDALRRRRLLQV